MMMETFLAAWPLSELQLDKIAIVVIKIKKWAFEIRYFMMIGFKVVRFW